MFFVDLQVHPNVHASFHRYIMAELHKLEEASGDARRRRSDAKLVSSLCQEMNRLCEADPARKEQAAADFRRYQEVSAFI
jgi:hypothetical protein